MCREIIGYKLKDQNLAKAASMIANGNPDGMKLVNEFNISIKAAGIEKLEKAGVLELWFEPIYEEEKFKVGDWVKYIGVSSTICKNGYIYKLEDIDSDGWVYHICDDGSRNGYRKKNYKLATKQEIEQHLIAEAKRRGFGKGIKWINPIYENYEFASKGNFTSEFSGDNIIYLYLDHNTIYNKGEWAEIIKDEEIEISGYKAKFDKARKTVQFGCKTITLEELKAVLVVMELNKKFDYRFSISNNVICTIGEWHKYGEIRNCVTKEIIQKLIKILEDE